MDKKILYIDMDGVVADFADAFFGRFPYVKDMDNTAPPKIHDGPVDHDADKSPQSKEIDFLITHKFRDIFRELKPIPGAIEAVKTLDKHYDIYLLSTPMWILPESYTDKRLWAEGWLGKTVYKKLILTHNKGINEGDYLIDDRIKNGVAKFKGEHIHFGQERFPNWDAVLAYLSEKDGWSLN